MQQLAVDTEKAIEMIKNKQGDPIFSEHSLVYNFATENITGFVGTLEPKDKQVLSAAGSLDQALNFLLHGAKDVTLFDINKLTYYYGELKKTAITYLPYNEFMLFFVKNEKRFNNDIYKRFNMFLSVDVKRFWDILFLLFSGSEIYDNLLITRAVHSSRLESINPYTRKDKYLELQEKLFGLKFRYLHGNIVDLELDKNYDLMYLSNIFDYLKPEEIESLKKSLMKKLNPNGVIATYEYLASDELCDVVFENYQYPNVPDGLTILKK